MKRSRWWSMAVGGALSLGAMAAHALDLRFGANDPEGHVVSAVINVLPLDIVASQPVILSDGRTWRRFSGQAEGPPGWVVDVWDVGALIWGTQTPQTLVVDNYLFADGGSHTRLNLVGEIWYGDTAREIGIVNLNYRCVCDDLFLAEGNELTEKAFARFDGVYGDASIERQELVWVEDPGGEGHSEWRVTKRQAVTFGTPPVPEPETWAMVGAGLGLAVLGARGRRRLQRQNAS